MILFHNIIFPSKWDKNDRNSGLLANVVQVMVLLDLFWTQLLPSLVRWIIELCFQFFTYNYEIVLWVNSISKPIFTFTFTSQGICHLRGNNLKGDITDIYSVYKQRLIYSIYFDVSINNVWIHLLNGKTIMYKNDSYWPKSNNI